MMEELMFAKIGEASGTLLGPRRAGVVFKDGGSKLGTVTVFACGLVHIAADPNGYADKTVNASLVERIDWM